MKVTTLTVLLSLCAIVGSCNNIPTRSQSPVVQKFSQQQFLFEWSHTNFAWGYQHSGFYLDNQGNVFKYAYERDEKPWTPKKPDSLTKEDLTEKYNHGRTWVASLDTKLLLEKYELIQPASMGSYSERVSTGADMGGHGSICYVYDEMTETYRGITLRVEGDWSHENTSPAAKTLADWLESLNAILR